MPGLSCLKKGSNFSVSALYEVATRDFARRAWMELEAAITRGSTCTMKGGSRRRVCELEKCNLAVYSCSESLPSVTRTRSRRLRAHCLLGHRAVSGARPRCPRPPRYALNQTWRSVSDDCAVLLQAAPCICALVTTDFVSVLVIHGPWSAASFDRRLDCFDCEDVCEMNGCELGAIGAACQVRSTQRRPQI